MSKESIAEKEPEGISSFKQWIYNPRTKQFLGRTGASWAKVGFFYIIFYLCLAIFWAMMLKIFMATISFERPKWLLDESLIGTNPGLGFRPSPKIEKVDSTLIHFRPGRNESYFPWVQDLNNFLQPYKEAYKKRSECSDTSNGKCPFAVDLSSHSCGDNFGYDTGSPCVLIKLNRIYNWKPIPFRDMDSIRNAMSQYKNLKIKPNVNENDISKDSGQISVQCEGQDAADKEKLGSISYWPRQGFPVEYFPYTKQANYLSPFVLVKFERVAKGSAVNVECIAMDKNIQINKYDREGSVNFQLLIES